MIFLTFYNFSIKTGLILSAPQEQGHMISSFEKFLLKSPIVGRLEAVVKKTKNPTKLNKQKVGFMKKNKKPKS